ncbi:MAG: WD40 repeat domain-containing protein [Sandaracinus sp.]|nr:WD40 repeat domain-containing protein [Sandaracinus sp.]MCB9620281.1 WD40 repeat domain-containing protein [Sandaracinus sp.]MCB9634042.1 WD40 repeat domain-containing protein [Sandaracinus sp.]
MTRFVSILVFAFACSQSTEPPIDPIDPIDPVNPVDPVTSVSDPLTRCFLDGGELVLRHEVDNDDVTEHGEVISFATQGERLAVGSADGTLKLWTLDGFLGTLSSGELLYGAELAATPSLDLTFVGDEVFGGDARGLVTAWAVPESGDTFTGAFRVVGGTDPDVAIVAVAVDGEWLAHAEAREGGAVRLRRLDGSTVIGPLEVSMENVLDLAFVDDALFVAGDALVRVDAEGRVDTRADVEAHELAGRGQTLATVDGARVRLFDTELNERWTGASEAFSVALSPDAGVVFLLDAESLEVRAADDGRVLTRRTLDAGVVVRSDAASVFTASRDGFVRAFGCE